MDENILTTEFNFYALNNDFENSHRIDFPEKKVFQHTHLEFARNFILENLKEVKDKKEYDLCVSYFETTNGEEMQEILIFSDNSWSKLENDEFLLENKFELLFQSESYDSVTGKEKEPINSWDDIVQNFKSFQEIDKKEPSQVLKKIKSFFHWYYLPEEELFAPSKFLGYKNATIQEYDSSGHGGQTQQVLQEYFQKLDKESEEFKRLYSELSQIHKNNFGKDLNTKVLNGTGGIYIPKN